MSKKYTSDQEFLLFTNQNNPLDFQTGAINYQMVSNKVSKDDLAISICPKGYSYRFIKGDELQQMIDDGKIS